MYDCLDKADGLIIMTEWNDFRLPNFDQIKSRLKSPVIFDGRNLFKTQQILSEGFEYYAIGKRITR